MLQIVKSNSNSVNNDVNESVVIFKISSKVKLTGITENFVVWDCVNIPHDVTLLLVFVQQDSQSFSQENDDDTYN